MAYLRALRDIVAERGIQNVLYVDESGFAASSHRPYGWAARGEKVYGERSGNARPRTSLIAARRGKDFLAPMLFEGTAHTALVNHWFEHQLIPELRPASTIIWDNAAFHNKENLSDIAAKYGHFVLFLPRYSPDFSPIEHDFANLKKIRQYASPNTTIDEIINMYNCC